LLAFALALATFFGAADLAFASLAVFLSWGAPFCWLTAFLNGCFLGRNEGALCRSVGGCLGRVGFWGSSYSAHDDSLLWSREKARGKATGRHYGKSAGEHMANRSAKVRRTLPGPDTAERHPS